MKPLADLELAYKAPAYIITFLLTKQSQFQHRSQNVCDNESMGDSLSPMISSGSSKVSCHITSYLYYLVLLLSL